VGHDQAADHVARAVLLAGVADGDLDVAAERDLPRIAPRVATGLLHALDALSQPLDVRAEGEADAVGVAGGQPDHLRAGGRDVDRRLGDVE
jgi:hypothetical protein